MDALLQIIVPKIPETDEIRIEQAVYELDGVRYPRDGAIVSWRGIALQFDETTPYLEKSLPPSYLGKDWTWLKVPDDVLERYDVSIKTGSEYKNQLPLQDYVRTLLTPLDRWVVAFIWHYDQIDSVYKMDVDEVVNKLRTNLEQDQKTEGFISYG